MHVRPAPFAVALSVRAWENDNRNTARDILDRSTDANRDLLCGARIRGNDRGLWFRHATVYNCNEKDGPCPGMRRSDT